MGLQGDTARPGVNLTSRALDGHHIDQSPLSPVLALDLNTQREGAYGAALETPGGLLREAGSADGRWAAFSLEVELGPEG